MVLNTEFYQVDKGAGKANYKLQLTTYKLQITNYKLQLSTY